MERGLPPTWPEPRPGRQEALKSSNIQAEMLAGEAEHPDAEAMPGVGGPPTALRRNDSQPRLKVAPSLFRRERLLRKIGLSLSYPGI